MLASMQPTDSAVIGATEAAEVLGISKDTLIRMIARGVITKAQKLPALNGAYILDRAEIVALAEQAKEVTA